MKNWLIEEHNEDLEENNDDLEESSVNDQVIFFFNLIIFVLPISGG
jgi:hypothetical protein